MPPEDELYDQRARGDLRVVCVMFLFWSGFFLLVDFPHVVFTPPGTYELKANPCGFVFLIALAMHWRWGVGRILAIIFTFIFMVGGLGEFLRLLPLKFINFEGPRVLPNVPENVVLWLGIPFLFAQWWQLRVLLRADVRELFAGPGRRKGLYVPPPLPEEKVSRV